MDAATELEAICVVVHEANRTYRKRIGEDPGPAWADAPEEMKASIQNGVVWLIAHPDAPPSASHEEWYRHKQKAGWAWGPVKNAEKKLHPNMLEYVKLPFEQRMKDFIFISVIAGMRAYLQLRVAQKS